MPTILSQKRTPVYNSVGELVGHNVETLSTIDPPGTPPAKPLATAVHTCAQCHQAQTACRCTPTPAPAPTPAVRSTPRTSQDSAEAWQPLSILSARDKDTPSQAPPMSAEMRTLKAHQDAWWTVYANCVSHEKCLVPTAQLRACSTQQLIALYGQLARGVVVHEWQDEVQEAWRPKGLLG